MAFWIAAALVTVATFGLLVLALLRGRPQGLTAAERDLAVYRDQLREVERDLARGVIAPEDAERLRTEVARRILEADRRRGGATEGSRGGRAGALAGLALLAVAATGAFLLYRDLGAAGLPDMPLSARIAAAEAARASRPNQAEAEAAQIDRLRATLATLGDDPTSADGWLTLLRAHRTVGDGAALDAALARARAALADRPEELALVEDFVRVADLMDQLGTRLAERPQDAAGLALQAQYEARLGNFPLAARAQDALVRLQGPAARAEDFAALAELLYLAAGGPISPEGEAALTEALRRNPREPVARYYSGLLLLQTGRPDLAFAVWRPLLAESSPADPWYAPLRAQIEDVAWLAGAHSYTPPAPAGQRGPSAEDMAAAAAMSPEARAEMIRGMVAGLAERLAAEGGPASDWARLIGALAVLGERERAGAILGEAREVFAGRAEDLAQIEGAARAAGIGR